MLIMQFLIIVNFLYVYFMHEMVFVEPIFNILVLSLQVCFESRIYLLLVQKKDL